jgi:hypothetical protein
VYADALSLLNRNVCTVTKDTSAPVDACREVRLEEVRENIIFRRENAGQNYNVKKPNKFFEILSRFWEPP